MYSEEFVLCRFFFLLYCDGAVSLSSLVRVANEIGLAGLHRAKALCLVSLGETTVPSPSEREGRMEEEGGGFVERKRASKGFWGKGEGKLIVKRKTCGNPRLLSQLSSLILDCFF